MLSWAWWYVCECVCDPMCWWQCHRVWHDFHSSTFHNNVNSLNNDNKYALPPHCPHTTSRIQQPEATSATQKPWQPPWPPNNNNHTPTSTPSMTMKAPCHHIAPMPCHPTLTTTNSPRHSKLWQQPKKQSWAPNNWGTTVSATQTSTTSQQWWQPHNGHNYWWTMTSIHKKWPLCTHGHRAMNNQWASWAMRRGNHVMQIDEGWQW